MAETAGRHEDAACHFHAPLLGRPPTPDDVDAVAQCALVQLVAAGAQVATVAPQGAHLVLPVVVEHQVQGALFHGGKAHAGRQHMQVGELRVQRHAIDLEVHDVAQLGLVVLQAALAVGVVLAVAVVAAAPGIAKGGTRRPLALFVQEPGGAQVDGLAQHAAAAFMAADQACHGPVLHAALGHVLRAGGQVREALIGAVVVLVQGLQQQLVGVGEVVGAQGRQVVGAVTARFVAAQQVTVPLALACVEGDHLPGTLFEGGFHAIEFRVEEPATIIGVGDATQAQAGAVFLQLRFTVQLLDLQLGVVFGALASLALGGVVQFQLALQAPAMVDLPAGIQLGLGGDLCLGAHVASGQLAVAQHIGLEGQARAQLEAGLLPFDGFLGVGCRNKGAAQGQCQQGMAETGRREGKRVWLLRPRAFAGLEKRGPHADISVSDELLNDFRKEAGPSAVASRRHAAFMPAANRRAGFVVVSVVDVPVQG